MRTSLRHGFATFAPGIVLMLATASFAADEPKPAAAPPDLPAPVLVVRDGEKMTWSGRKKGHAANSWVGHSGLVEL